MGSSSCFSQREIWCGMDRFEYDSCHQEFMPARTSGWIGRLLV